VGSWAAADSWWWHAGAAGAEVCACVTPATVGWRMIAPSRGQWLDRCILLPYTLSMGLLERLRACTGFQWDDGNVDKNWIRHRVARAEAEEVLLNEPLVLADDDEHSATEERCYALGQTNRGRLLFLVFTIRRRLVRVISVRDMTKREREVYRSHG
jgi:uncharacterized protein